LVPLCLGPIFLKSLGRLYTNILLNATAITLDSESYLNIVHEFCKPAKPLLYFMFFCKEFKKLAYSCHKREGKANKRDVSLRR